MGSMLTSKASRSIPWITSDEGTATILSNDKYMKERMDKKEMFFVSVYEVEIKFFPECSYS